MTETSTESAPSEKKRSGLAGRVGLVTGGGSGIGLACAQRLAADGAAVTICGRSERRLKDAMADLPAGANYRVCDITDENDVRRAVEFVLAERGRLDIAVVNAGYGIAGSVLTTELDAWQGVLATNLTGSFLTIKHAARAMAQSGGGSIIAISSIAGLLTHRYMVAYCVSKAGLEMLVKNAADELGPLNIRVNSVRPGLVPTDASDALVVTKAVQEDYLAQMPLGRLGAPEDVAAAVRYLAGDEASWVTGQVFAVDGGHSLRRGPVVDPLIPESERIDGGAWSAG